MISSAPCRIFRALAFFLVFANIALGQSPQTTTWGHALAVLANSKQTVYVVTIAHPKNHRTCLVQSINASEIVCTHRGHSIAYRAEDVSAIISPGTHTRWYLYAAGFLGAGGAATWGTIALATVCAPCAVITGIAAFVLYWMAPASAMMTDGDSPDTPLYLAPRQTVSVNPR